MNKNILLILQNQVLIMAALSKMTAKIGEYEISEKIQEECNKTISELDKSIAQAKGNYCIAATPAEPKPATVAFTEDSFEIQCVDKLIDSCLKSFPNSKVPQTLAEKQKWAVEIERMKRLDGRTESDIMQALNYAITDIFWQGNIRSTKKFREKFETLIIRCRNTSNCKSQNNFNNSQQNDYDFEELERQLLSN